MDQDPTIQSARHAGPRPLRDAWHWTLHWSPVWIPLVLLAQILILGLRPALARSRALDQLTPQVMERYDATHATHGDLTREAEAWEDEIFVERHRRALNRGR